MKVLSTPVSVTRTIAAPVGSLFAVLAEPRRHQELDGSGMLRGTDFPGRVVEVGEVFVMRMHHGPLGDYEMINHVVELEEDRRIAWEPESGKGHPDAGSDKARWGHRWAFELAPDGPSRTVVTHTWDCSRAAQDEDGEHWRVPMDETLARLEALCTRAAMPGPLTFAPPSVGDRLLLRPLQASDVDDVHRFQSDPVVVPYIPWPVRTRDETSAWLAKVAGGCVAAEGDYAVWAVERLEDRRVIGSVNLSWTSSGHGQAEIGFVLATDAQGSGYAAEATLLLLDAAFPALGLHRVFARVDARNEPSLRLLRRLGLRQEAHLVGEEVLKGERVDVVVFAVLADEWQQLRQAARHVSAQQEALTVADVQDREQIAYVLRTFFAAFTSAPDVVARLAGLREVLLPGAVIVKTCGAEPTVYDVEGFIAPRQALLTAGHLTGFREWEVRGQTQVFGDVAQHFCVYAKSWVQDGRPATGCGMKTIQLVRTGEGWRISAVAWDDERDGLSVGDPPRLGETHPARSQTAPGPAG